MKKLMFLIQISLSMGMLQAQVSNPNLKPQIVLQAVNQGTIILLSWNAYNTVFTQFEIQRLLVNDTQFVTIAKVSAIKPLSDSLTYDFEDGTSHQGNNYYRLRMLDQNQQIIYSKISHAYLIKNINTTLYPVPFSTELNMVTNLDNEADLNFVLRDMTGKVVSSISAFVASGIQITSMPLQGVVIKGNYLVSVIDTQGNSLASYIVVRQ